MSSILTALILGQAISGSGIGASGISGPTIDARSAIIVDEASGKVLWGRNPNTPMYPASTTKIMTAMLLLEHSTPGEIITAPQGVEDVEPSSMNLKTGEKVRVKDMLYALMLRSANDGCVAVAHHVAGSVPNFAELMNRKAEQLGCTNTFFTNPNGLPDENHVTTANDLTLMARAAMKYPLFREVVRTRKTRIARSINAKDLWMVNRNKYLAKDPSADGIKTGYTKAAKSCYVGSATRENFRVITAILGSEEWVVDHAAMLRWAYKNYDRQVVFRAGAQVGQIELSGLAKPISAFTGINIISIIRPGKTDGTLKIEALPDLRGPILKKQKVGEATWTDSDGFEQRFAVFASEAVDLAPVRGNSLLGGTLWLGVGVAGGAWFLQNRNRRRFLYGRRKRKLV